MKRFESRLQALQRLRDQEEQLARAGFAACRQRAAAAEDGVGRARQKLVDAGLELSSSVGGAACGEVLSALRSLYRQREFELLAAGTEFKAATIAAEEALSSWNAARAASRAVEQRIDRERREHRRNELMEDERQIHELAAQESLRRSPLENGVSES